MATGKAFELAIKIGGEMLPSLRRSVENAQKQISTLSQTVTRDLDGAFRKAEKAAGRVADNRLWRTAAAGATAYVGAVGLAVREAVTWDTAMANVRKGLGDAGAAAMARFEADALRLSTQMAISGDELLNIGAQFALAGEDIGDLIPLMQTAARMSVAFDMSSTDAADAMLALRASTGKSNEELVKLADAINHVGDNIKGKVSGGDLLDLTSQLAGIMNITSLTAEEFAGLGAAFLATGTPVERARTGMKNLLNAMQAGSTATTERLRGISMIFSDGVLADPKASKAQKDAAKRSSMQIADDLAQRMVDDPKAAIADVIERMSRLDPKLQPQALKLLVGEEGKAAIAPLLTNPELVREAMGLVANPMDYQGSMLREYENQSKAASRQMALFGNQLKSVGIVIGSTLLPPLTDMLKALGPGLQRFAEWGQSNKALVGTLTMVGLALSGLVLVAPGIAALVSLLGSLGGAFLGGTGAMAALAGSLGVVGPAFAAIKAGGAIAGVKALGAAFAAMLGPVGLTIAAVIGVGLALKALYDKVPAFRGAVDRTWASVRAVFGHALDGIQGLFKAFGGVFKAIYALIAGDGAMLRRAWGEIIDGMAQWWQALQDGLDDVLPGLSPALEGAMRVLSVLFTGDVTQMGKGWRLLKEGWDEMAPLMTQGIKDWLSRLGDVFKESARESGKQWAIEFAKNTNPAHHAAQGVARAAGAVRDAIRPQGLPRSAAQLPPGTWPEGVPMPARALGGAVHAMQPTMVGERGPEVFVPPVSGRIVPHRDLLSVTQKLALDAPQLKPLQVAGIPERAFGGPVWRDQPAVVGERGAPEVFLPSSYSDTISHHRQEVIAAGGGGMVVNIGGIKIEGADTSNTAAIEAAVTHALRQAERRWANRAGQRVRLLLND